MENKLILPICCYCHKQYDNTKDNYGWHLRDGLVEHCMFPLQMVSKFNPGKFKRVMRIANIKKED